MADADFAAVRNWLDTAYKDFADSWTERWNAYHANPPECLYHYTTGSGANGILTDQVIWATDARYLNDASELSHIHTVFSTVAQELSEKFSDGPAQEFLKAAASSLLDASVGPFAIYVTCFCVCDDLLSQWRGYTPGSQGYALGFAAEPMRTIPGIRLRRVIYDPVRQQELVQQVLEFIARGLALFSIPDAHVTSSLVAALVAAGGTLAETAFCLKNPGFCQEREWRLVLPVLEGQHPEHSDVQFRETVAGLVPYVEVRPSADGPPPIREVILGPNRHPDLTEAAVQRLLETRGFSVRVRRSKIPLRV